MEALLSWPAEHVCAGAAVPVVPLADLREREGGVCVVAALGTHVLSFTLVKSNPSSVKKT